MDTAPGFPIPHRPPVRVLDLPDIWRFEDCCSVYVLRQGDRAVLIDLGSGAVLDHLDSMGIRTVERVYFTHAHRDQCQGADRALAAGIPLYFPRDAREFVHPKHRPDLQKPTPLLRCYPGRFDPPRPIETPQFTILSGQRLSFGDLDIEVQAAPGHLDHQVAYLLDYQDRRLCFSGDAIHSAGKIHEAYHWETDHYTGAGLRTGIETLRVLRHHRPDVLLPSHGPVTEGDPWAVFEETEAAMRSLAELKDTIVPRRPAVRRLVRPRSGELQRVSDHLYIWNNSYFLLSDDGPVLMVDNAGPLPEPFWDQYGALLGDRPIEAVLVTHIHCDHVEGVEFLRRQGWTGEVWTHAAIADCVENPHRFRRPWLSEWPVRVDRRIGDGESFHFHEHVLTAYFAPGQTDLHAGYEITIDGHRAILSGDNFYPAQQWGGTGGLCGLNGGHPELWRRTIDLYLRLEPEWVLASHIHPYEYCREDFLAMRRWCDEVSAAMCALSPDGSLDRHHSPHVFNLEPYVQQAGPGETVTIQGSFRNPYARAVRMAARLVVPEGWQLDCTEWSDELPPNGVAQPEWRVRAAGPPGMRLLTADLVFDGSYLGEKAECYVRLLETGGCLTGGFETGD
jgi:glyoxylase-like metal-dependent hydrolase (beta-lactamase superfamily II)